MTPDNREAPPTSSISSEEPRSRSCSGLLYYSSSLKSKARNPLCFGLSRPQDAVNNFTAVKADQDATKYCKSLLDFKYACAGYSVHRENEAITSNIPSDKPIDIPFCMGIEVLSERRAAEGVTATKQQHIDQKEAAPNIPRLPPSVRPAGISRTFHPEEFGFRFIHSAGLVAAAVWKNLLRVGKSVKSMANDMVYRDAGRPK